MQLLATTAGLPRDKARASSLVTALPSRVGSASFSRRTAAHKDTPLYFFWRTTLERLCGASLSRCAANRRAPSQPSNRFRSNIHNFNKSCDARYKFHGQVIAHLPPLLPLPPSTHLAYRHHGHHGHHGHHSTRQSPSCVHGRDADIPPFIPCRCGDLGYSGANHISNH